MNRLAWIVVVFLGLVSCAASSGEKSEELKKMERLVSHNISIGDAKEKVVSFFKSKNWVFVYDELQNSIGTRVNRISKSGKIESSILILVKLSKDGSVREIIVHESFDAP